MSAQIETRLTFAIDTARKAGEIARAFFADIGSLNIELKGAQDFVSNADKEVELFIRAQIAAHFPDDGIVGEEHENVDGASGYTWVIDPIDGTANFVSGIPAWCVILGCVHDDQTKIAAIYEPSNDEMFSASLGTGAYLNGKPMHVSKTTGLNSGNLGVGFNNRTEPRKILYFLKDLTDRGGIFFRNASGGLMLSYVAAGRLIGYAEPHMNAWDCLAAQLLISEAGGIVEKQSANEMLVHGGRVIAAPARIFDELLAMAIEAEF